MISRRHALQLLGAGLVAESGVMSVAVARLATERRLVVVILRGALDGLAAVPAYADPDYAALRGPLAMAEPGRPEGALDLDGRFGLHPALRFLHELYARNELLVVHAVATPDRSRSHFDGQDLLENGTAAPRGARDGWLNRALGLMTQPATDRRIGLGVGRTVPLLLRGATPVGSFTPQVAPEVDGDFLARLAALYRPDPVLGPAIAEGLRAQAMSEEVLGADKRMAPDALRGPGAIKAIAGALGKLLAAPAGARVAVLELGGWDTHANQGLLDGRLANQLRALADGLAALKDGLGPAWRETAVAVATEFGRTVAANGTGGTDHGTAGVAFLIGGAVLGGRVLGRWPGLGANRLFEGRDLAPTTDLRSLFKALLADHLGLPEAAIERLVFPGSHEAPPLRDTLRV
ncbi:MAG: DUF1501 domain-containing protein [Pseudomonadota bacterium]